MTSAAEGHRHTKILGVPVPILSRETAINAVGDMLKSNGSFKHVCFINAHTAMTAYDDLTFLDILDDADLILNDGIGVQFAAWTTGHHFPDNLNGTDFTRAVLEIAGLRGSKVYLLGGRPGVAVRAAANLRTSVPSLHIVGVHDGYFGEDENTRVVRNIADCGAELLLVALGNPRQEYWVAANGKSTGVSVAMSVGAFLDFSADVVPRAPKVLRMASLEWIFRLLIEPRRLWRRYIIGGSRFMHLVITFRIARRPPKYRR